MTLAVCKHPWGSYRGATAPQTGLALYAVIAILPALLMILHGAKYYLHKERQQKAAMLAELCLCTYAHSELNPDSCVQKVAPAHSNIHKMRLVGESRQKPIAFRNGPGKSATMTRATASPNRSLPWLLLCAVLAMQTGTVLRLKQWQL